MIQNNMLEKILDESLRQNIPLIDDEMADFLRATVAEKQPKTVLEIGSGIGYSGYVICVSCPNAHLTTLEIDKNRFEQAKRNLAGYNAKCLNVDCKEWLKENTAQFDLIFLDGPKGFYDRMLETIVRALEPGGILIADNIFFHGMVTGQTEVTKGARSIARHLLSFINNAKMRADLEVEILNKADGILIAKKRS